MEYHLERELRLDIKPDKTLYSWAINEIDAQGQQIGYERIPLRWTLFFTATSCLLGDGIEIRSSSNRGADRAAPAHSRTSASGQPAGQ